MTRRRRRRPAGAELAYAGACPHCGAAFTLRATWDTAGGRPLAVTAYVPETPPEAPKPPPPDTGPGETSPLRGR